MNDNVALVLSTSLLHIVLQQWWYLVLCKSGSVFIG